LVSILLTVENQHDFLRLFRYDTRFKTDEQAELIGHVEPGQSLGVRLRAADVVNAVLRPGDDPQ